MNSPYGVLATSYQGQPFAHVNIFAYDPNDHAIYIHNAEHGRTPHNISIDERVCFTAAEMGRLLPAKSAQNFSVEYSSVVIFGSAEIITELDPLLHGLQLLLNKYFPEHKPGKDYANLDQSQLDGVIIIKINILEWSAKQKIAPNDFPGAFSFQEIGNE
jgi:nitroimidazol reductase NimA-like FMN-containing flavoprotein (pyridoxamine 5'-phosphate oxidase superfamily)